MLRTLRISNIVLVEKADIAFRDGFNVLTGETGSGKSAVMGALNYIAGSRADANMLRHGAEMGAIEASFDIDGNQEALARLTAAGISHEKGDELIIRRELSRSGKSRAFVNNQLAQVALLRDLGECLLDIVGQHANQRLTSLDKQREILDLFGANAEAGRRFKESWMEECRLKKELDKMIRNEAERLREIDRCKKVLEELEEAAIKENEDEELFSEYSRLANSEEIAKQSLAITSALAEESQPIIPQLHRLEQAFESLIKHDPGLKSLSELLRSATLELEEIAHEMRNYHASVEYNPYRIEEINCRLSLINKIKRKYGPSLSEVHLYFENTKEELSKLEMSDLEIESLQKRIAAIEKETDKLALELTKKRKTASEQLEMAMKEELSALNMGKACFYVSITPQARNCHGDESVEFLFTPNVGEKKIAIKDCASGGELSRIMLALQTILSGKEQTPTIIFDEIDANIGGETAAVVGEKLRELGRGHQVLCITHFPQVAACASHHFQISKKEMSGRTYTEIVSLDAPRKKKELARMEGKRKAKP